MYRQIDKERNVEVMKIEEFPDHIKVGGPAIFKSVESAFGCENCDQIKLV
jgi:hypothetical protein